MTRDQTRARMAYDRVEQVTPDHWDDYRTVAFELPMNVLRVGLSAALSDLERKIDRRGVDEFVRDLARALPTEFGAGGDLPSAARTADVAKYMLLTREVVKLSTWFKRAAQARGARSAARA